MSRRLPITLSLLLILLSSPLVARNRAAARVAAPPGAEAIDLRNGAALVSGRVTGVSGNLISLANGSVVVDAAGARITDDRGREVTVSAIKQGMMVFAVLQNNSPAPNAPLQAKSIGVVTVADVTLHGQVQSVDMAGNSFVVLGRTVRVNAETSFGGGLFDGRLSLADLQPGQLVVVQANHVNGSLLASSVLIAAPVQEPGLAFRGTVKSIGNNSWVVTEANRGDITLQINNDTRIIGSPRVGDVVEVLARLDSSNSYVALLIARHESLPSPEDFVSLRGTVKSISAASWVITEDGGRETTVKIGEDTRILLGPVRTGDSVVVLAQRGDDGSLTAILITRLR